MVPGVRLHLRCWTRHGRPFEFDRIPLVVLNISRLILGLPCLHPEAYTGGLTSSLRQRLEIHSASWLATATR